MANRIRVIDFETTGLAPPDAVVIEQGLVDMEQIDGEWLLSDPASSLYGATSIPPEVRAVHHIRLSEVHGLAPFSASATEQAARDVGVVVFAAHNAEFEQQFLKTDLPLLCTYKAALRIWPEAPSHSNGALRYWLEDMGIINPVHEHTQPPHRAGPDAYVTAHILRELLNHATAKQMVAWTKEPRLLPRCTLGKFRGKPWAEVETGFLTWMLAQPTMETDLKWNAQRELDRRSA